METNNKPDLAVRIWSTVQSMKTYSSNPDDYIKPWVDLIEDVVKERDTTISELETTLANKTQRLDAAKKLMTDYYVRLQESERVNGVYAEEFHNKTSTILNLEAKVTSLKTDITERLDAMDRFDKAEKQWFSENERLKSELDKAIELLKEADNYYTSSKLRDFLKDKK